MSSHGKKLLGPETAKNLLNQCRGDLQCWDNMGTIYKQCAIYSYDISDVGKNRLLHAFTVLFKGGVTGLEQNSSIL
jgi:hypothetical protein